MNKARVAALMLALIIPGSSAMAAGTGIVPPSATHTIQQEVQKPRLSRDEFIQVLGMEPPLGDVGEQAVDNMYDFYLRVADVMDDTRSAIPGENEQPDAALLEEIEQQAELLDDEMDAFEDSIKATYRAGSLTRDEYNFYKAELEYIDDGLDVAEAIIDAILEDYWDDDRNEEDMRKMREHVALLEQVMELKYPHGTPEDDDYYGNGLFSDKYEEGQDDDGRGDDGRGDDDRDDDDRDDDGRGDDDRDDDDRDDDDNDDDDGD